MGTPRPRRFSTGAMRLENTVSCGLCWEIACEESELMTVPHSFRFLHSPSCCDNIISMEHPYKTIIKQFKASEENGEYPRVVLLFGREEFLVDWSLKRIRASVLAPAAAALDLSVFSEDDVESGAVIAACETLPVMSKRKLVICDWPSDTVEKALAEYLPQLPDTSMLVFRGGRPNKTRSLYKQIAKCGLVYDFTSLDEETLVGWMSKRLKAADRTASSRDLIDFAKNAGYWDKERDYTLYNLENDIKKLIAYTDEMQITRRTLEAVAGMQPETAAFKLMDAAFSQRKGEALLMLRNNIDMQQSSKQDGVVFQLLGLICSQLEIMVEAKERKEEGQSAASIEKAMGINPFRLKKAMAAADKRSLASLQTSLSEAYDMEEKIKGGLMPPQLAMELFIAGL